MNTRYIFRGKREDNGEWIYGNFCCGNERQTLHDSIFVYDCETQSFGNYDIIPETVGQCTGLKDKNGKLIFEEDILYDKESGFIGTVKFGDVIAGFIVVINDTTPTFYHWSWLNKGDVTRSKNLKNTEVIGNEFDNPELLEVER